MRIRPFLLCLLACSAAAEQTNLCREISIPILTVTGDESRETGALQRVTCRWERKAGPHRLRVALSDNEPGGTGESFSTAAWNAAVTAGFLRNDPMTGVRISMDIDGGYDGPSAGGVMCLAFLAALDGRTLPDDFGMTGSVSPDGSVGTVGSVAEKVRAAAASGLKRFAIPSGIRYEDRSPEGANPPDYVDLATLGERLGVTVRRVDTIGEAYAFAMGDAATNLKERVDEQAVLSLPPAFERFCRERVVESETARRKRMESRKGKAHRKERRDSEPELAEEIFADWAEDPVASEMYSSDRPYSAFREAVFTEQAAAFEPELKALRKISPTNLAARVRDFSLPGLPEGGYRRMPGSPVVAAQLASAPRIIACCAEDVARIADDGRADGDGDGSDGGKGTDPEYEANLKLLALQLFHAGRIKSEPFVRDALGRTLQDRRISGDPCAVAHFLYAAWKSAYRDFETDALAEIGRERGDSADRVLEQLAGDDRSLVFIHAFADAAADEIALLDETVPGRRAADPRYHAVAAACTQAETLGLVCGLRAKYGADGSAGVARAVRRARAAALADLARCRRADIPCPAAVAAFLRAERAAGSAGADVPCDVLGNYLAASFLVRALMWIFV